MQSAVEAASPGTVNVNSVGSNFGIMYSVHLYADLYYPDQYLGPVIESGSGKAVKVFKKGKKEELQCLIKSPQ
jgi:uncharacterized membrane protein